MKRLLAFACVTLLAGMLAGCADSLVEDQAAPSPSNPNTNTDPAPEPKTEPAPTGSDPATCIHGAWLANNDFFLASIQEFGDEVQSVTGQVTLQFDDDGTLTTHYQDWQITAEAEGMQVLITRVGTDVGTFSATETALTLADTTIGSTLTVSAAGSDTRFDPLPADYSDAPYSCSSAEAIITTSDGSLELSRQ